MMTQRLLLVWLIGVGGWSAFGQTKSLPRADSVRIENWYARWQALRITRPDSSETYARLIERWGVQHRQPQIEARGLNSLAIETRDKGNFTTAVPLFQRALTLHERSGNTEGVALANSGLALTYKRMADAHKITSLSEQALVFARRSLVLNEQIHNTANVANSYNLVGIIQRDLRAFEEARQAYRQGIELLEQNRINNITLTTLYGNMAQLLVYPDKEYDQAILYLNKALALNRTANRRTNLEHNLRNLSDVYRLKKEYAKAVQFGEEAVQISYQINDPHRLFNTLGVVYKAHRDAGNFQKALGYLEQAKTIEDSIGRADKTREITRLQAEFDNKRTLELAQIEAEKVQQIDAVRTNLSLQQERALAQLEADKDRDLMRTRTQADVTKARFASHQKEVAIQRLQDKTNLQQQQLAWLSLGAGLFVLLSGLLFWQYRRIRQHRGKMQQQSEQLRLLMRELHHRVKNNLAIVSGLLELQSNRLSDEGAKRAFREGQQRVQAMSILHQRLYQTDALTTIDMGEYASSLIQSLMGAYGYTSDTLQVDVSMGKQEIDVDLAIPLGLILNELLTNAFKYALPNTVDPKLSVDLKRQSDELSMCVSDNGPGLDLSRWQRPGGSFGKRLIAGLLDQVGGIVSVENRNGTQFLIRIPV